MTWEVERAFPECHTTPPTWLDAHGRRRPTLACWTFGRQVAPMRSAPRIRIRTVRRRALRIHCGPLMHAPWSAWGFPVEPWGWLHYGDHAIPRGCVTAGPAITPGA